MKWFLPCLFALGVALVMFGPPGPRPERTRGFHPAKPVLPMTFSHADHGAQSCVVCHHTFIDGIKGPACVRCHLTDPEVSGLFEAQFHTLCRSCHVEERVAGKPTGPTRRCIACHLPEKNF